MATGNLGNLTIGLILNTDKFGKGAKLAKKDLFGIKAAAMDLKKFFIGGFLGAAGFNSFSGAIKKGLRFLKDDMKDLEKFSGAERERLIKINKEIQSMEQAWRNVAKTITIAVLPAIEPVARFVNNLTEMLAFFGGADTHSLMVAKNLVDTMSNDKFSNFQAGWHAAGKDPDKLGRAAIKHFGAGVGDMRFVDFERAVTARISRNFAPVDNTKAGGSPMLGMGLFNMRMFQHMFNQPTPITEASLGQISRIQSMIGSMDVAGNIPRPGERRRIDMTTGGFSALEKGTAEAFSQEKRSQQQSQQIDLMKKQLKNDETQIKHLQNIDRNLKSAVTATEAANFA